MTASSYPADGVSEPVTPYVEEDLAGGLARLRRRTQLVATERWLAAKRA